MGCQWPLADGLLHLQARSYRATTCCCCYCCYYCCCLRWWLLGVSPIGKPTVQRHNTCMRWTHGSYRLALADVVHRQADCATAQYMHAVDPPHPNWGHTRPKGSVSMQNEQTRARCCMATTTWTHGCYLKLTRGSYLRLTCGSYPQWTRGSYPQQTHGPYLLAPVAAVLVASGWTRRAACSRRLAELLRS